MEYKKFAKGMPGPDLLIKILNPWDGKDEKCPHCDKNNENIFKFIKPRLEEKQVESRCVKCEKPLVLRDNYKWIKHVILQ